ncbi:MAG: Fur family transcriptional regulator [Dehalococcoidia bacterium]|nr:Fur family transcriptional regulator [Dehalococcoidia bacterium]
MQQYCDKKFIQHSLKVLKSLGHRLTNSRQLVLETLACNRGPASPYDIQKLLLEQGKRLDHVTIYRTLELLERLNLVHKVLSLGGYARCTLENEAACHGYLVCRGCGSLQEFADESLCHKEDELAEKHGFQAERHLTEFSGLCAGCQR